MKKICFVLAIILTMLSVCACARADTAWPDTFNIYWIGIDEGTEDRVVMKSHGDEDAYPIMKIDGYLLEGSLDGNVYYAARADQGRWEICEVDSGKPVAALEDPDMIRILAYQNDVAYGIKAVDGVPILTAFEEDRGMTYYPHGGYAEEFDSLAGDHAAWEIWGMDVNEAELDRTVVMYSTTISGEGKIAYCVDNTIAWQSESISCSIYMTTLNQADIYVGEGSHPAWLDESSLLYIGPDAKLYQYDVNEQNAHPFVSDDQAVISLPPIDPAERMIVIDDDYLGFVQLMQGEQKKLSLLSLRTGKTQTVDNVHPINFMDAIVRITPDVG